MCRRGLRSIRPISSAAAAGASPNLESAWPVRTLACVCARTPGITRTSTSCERPGGTVASSRSTSSELSTTTSPMPCSHAIAISSSLLALPCSTSSAGSAPAASALTISPPPATSSPSPSSSIARWTAVQGNALDANTTRERGQRAASPSAYSRARARSAASETTSTGVPNSAARRSARQPPMRSIPSASTALPCGNRDSRASTAGGNLLRRRRGCFTAHDRGACPDPPRGNAASARPARCRGDPRRCRDPAPGPRRRRGLALRLDRAARTVQGGGQRLLAPGSDPARGRGDLLEPRRRTGLQGARRPRR